MKTGLAFTFALMLSVGMTTTASAIDWEVTYHGKVVFSGECERESTTGLYNEEGSFTISQPSPKTGATYYAAVVVQRDGLPTVGFLLDPTVSRKARYIGELRMNEKGDCWFNKTFRICMR